MRPPVSAGAGTIFQRALAPSGWCLPGSCRNTRLRVLRLLAIRSQGQMRCTKSTKSWQCPNIAREGWKLCETHNQQHKLSQKSRKCPASKPLPTQLGHVQCSKSNQYGWRCQTIFKDEGHRWCTFHRAQQKEHNKSPKGIERETRRDPVVRKASTDRAEASMKASGKRAEINKKAIDKRRSDPSKRLMDVILSKVGKMLNGERQLSETVSSFTSFGTSEDVKRHFTQSFQPGMTMQNRGNSVGKWNCGHRIARACYDPSLAEDVRKCWQASNLFPQWWRENNALSVRLPSDDELLRLQSVWPASWNATLPSVDKRKEIERCARLGLLYHP